MSGRPARRAAALQSSSALQQAAVLIPVLLTYPGAALMQVPAVTPASKKQATGGRKGAAAGSFSDHNAKWLKPKAQQPQPSSSEEEEAEDREEEVEGSGDEQSLSGAEFSLDGMDSDDGAPPIVPPDRPCSLPCCHLSLS